MKYLINGIESVFHRYSVAVDSGFSGIANVLFKGDEPVSVECDALTDDQKEYFMLCMYDGNQPLQGMGDGISYKRLAA